VQQHGGPNLRLLDDFVGAREQGGWNFETEHFAAPAKDGVRIITDWRGSSQGARCAAGFRTGLGPDWVIKPTKERCRDRVRST
jgi:hypothetical protein